MSEEEILIALKEIHARYCIPASEQNYTDKDYACMQYEKLVIHLQKEIDRLNNKYNKALEILNEYSMPCERGYYNLLDTDYCEKNCSNDEEQFKKCWDEYIKWMLGDKE